MAEKIVCINNSTINEDEEEIEFKEKITLKLEDVSHFLQNDLLIDLINSKSIRMFKMFNISTKFQTIDPAYWHNQDDYKIGKKIKSLKIVNDAAEMGVKLMEEHR